jgi:hypothetical protein
MQNAQESPALLVAEETVKQDVGKLGPHIATYKRDKLIKRHAGDQA